jgi:hypothetical protein
LEFCETLHSCSTLPADVHEGMVAVQNLKWEIIQLILSWKGWGGEHVPLEYRYISKLPMKNEWIWRYVKETTSHLQKKLFWMKWCLFNFYLTFVYNCYVPTYHRFLRQRLLLKYQNVIWSISSILLNQPPMDKWWIKSLCM